MIKYFINEDKRQVIGLLEGTEFDALNKINKMLDGSPFSYWNRKCLMPDSFKAVVTCDPSDEFDVDTGKKIVKERIMNRYYRSFDKRIATFIADTNNMWGRFLADPIDK